jgi:hypothetical protein
MAADASFAFCPTAGRACRILIEAKAAFTEPLSKKPRDL